MFKYVWIIMLVIVAVIFIGYTIYAIYDSYWMAVTVRQATRAERDYGIKQLLSETFEYFWLTHGIVCGVWIVILLSVISGTFLFSLIEYSSSIIGG